MYLGAQIVYVHVAASIHRSFLLSFQWQTFLASHQHTNVRTPNFHRRLASLPWRISRLPSAHCVPSTASTSHPAHQGKSGTSKHIRADHLRLPATRPQDPGLNMISTPTDGSCTLPDRVSKLLPTLQIRLDCGLQQGQSTGKGYSSRRLKPKERHHVVAAGFSCLHKSIFLL
jgi:hypothetical protein